MKGMMDSLQSCRWLALLLIAVMLMQLVGCGGGGNSTNLSLVSEQPDTVDFFVQPSGSEAPILTTVSGSLMDIEALEKLVIDSAKDQSEIVFLVDNQNENAPASRTEFRVGRYRIRIAFDSHGFDHSRYTLCLPQDRELRHLNFEIEDMNIKNLIGSWHLISWMNVVPQFGIYNKWTDHTKPHNLDSYCRSTQGKFTLVKERIAEALRQSTKMSDNTVSYIAYVVAIIAMGALVAVAAPSEEGSGTPPPPPGESTGGTPPPLPGPITPSPPGGGSGNGSGGDTSGGGSGGSGGGTVTPPSPPGGGSGGGSGGGTTTDKTAPTISSASVTPKGNGVYELSATFTDNAYDKSMLWTQDPDYNWIQVGGWNTSNPAVLTVNLTGKKAGVWKFFAEAYDKAGNHLPRTDTQKRIGWGAPWIEDQSMEGPNATGQSTYQAKFDSFGGHADIDWVELFYWVSGRSYRIGNRISGYQAKWEINPTLSGILMSYHQTCKLALLMQHQFVVLL